MKSNTINSGLVALLFGLCLLATALSSWYVQLTRDLGRLQSQLNEVNRNQTLVQALVKETVEYSKHNPAIDPILQAFNVKPKTNSPTAPKSAGK